MKRWFSLVLVVTLCLTMTMGSFSLSIAEEEPITVADIVDEIIPEADDSQVELSDTFGAVISTDAQTGIEESDESTDAASDEDYAQEDGNDPDDPTDMPGDVTVVQDVETTFMPWYARAITPLALAIDEDISRTVPAGSILLVTEEVDNGLMRVVCEGLTGVVDITALEALTDEDVQDFMDALTLLEGVSFYLNDMNYPLPPQADETFPEQTAVGNNSSEPSEQSLDTLEDTKTPEEGTVEDTSEDAAQSEDGEQGEDSEPAEDAGNGEEEDAEAEEKESDDANSEVEKTEDEQADAEKAAAPEEKTETGESGEAAGAENQTIVAEADTAEKISAEAGAPASISLSINSITLGLKEVYTGLTASVVDANGTAVEGGPAITWASSNTRVVKVDAAGKLTAVRTGKATIVATAEGLPEAMVSVVVKKAPSKVTLSPKKSKIAVGASLQLSAKLSKGSASGALTFTSSNPAVATVDQNGLVTGVGIGKATITVRTYNKKRAKFAATVYDLAGQAADMVLNATTITIGVKEKYTRMEYTLVPQPGQEKSTSTVTWKSKNKKIAKVNSKTGVITGVKAGTTTIIATTSNKISRKVKVVVQKAPKSVSISPAELPLTPGMTGQLTASYNGSKVTSNVTYASSDSGVASVDQNGVVTAVGRGSATITVTTYNGKTASCTVNVFNDPAQVFINDTLTVAVGTSAQLNCSVVDSDGMNSSATYNYTAISGSGSVEVDEKGKVKGVSVGTARIRVTTHNGISTHYDGSGKVVTTECVVTIQEAPPIRYRVFSMYDFYNVPVKGSLTFPMNNATSFMEVMSGNSVDGVKYENVGLLENPSKDALISGIVSAFSGSKDTDINVIYLVSHGTNKVDIAKSASYTHYGLQLPGYSNYKSSSAYYVTSEELFNAISTINGKVVLVLDSCYSGQFITNMKSELDAAGGRISVMTAATNTTACYYNIANTSTACDFFTMYLLLGAGYNMRTHTYTGSYPADANADGKLTFSEMFNYAKTSVKANVPKYKKKSWFHGNYKQSPNVYVGSNGDLVLFQYS